jgi:hypothetical protein
VSAVWGALGLASFGLLVCATAWRIWGPHARDGPDAALGLLVRASALTVSSVTILSAFHRLTGASLLLLAAVGALVAWGHRLARWARGAEENVPARSATVRLPPRGERWILVGAIPIALFVLSAVHTAWKAPETGDDNMAYHLPRLGYWLQQRAVAPFIANDPRAGAFPPNGNVLQLVPVLFLRSDRLCGLVQLGAAVSAALAVYAIARGLGGTSFAASLAALCWFSIPCMLDQAALSMVDVIASFFVAAAAALIVRSPACGHHVLATLVSVGLALGTKTTTAVLVAPLALVSLVLLWRQHRALFVRAAVASPLAALALGGHFQLQNAFVWLHPNGPPSIQWLVASPSLASLVKNVRLCLLPLWSLLVHRDGVAVLHPLWESTTGHGLGLLFLLLAILSSAVLAVDALVSRSSPRGWQALALLSVGGALALCFALRHQVAVLRFLLPAAALESAVFARAFDRLATTRWRRFCAAAIVGVVASVVLWRWDGLARNRRRNATGWVSEQGRYGADLEVFAVELDRLAAGGGARVGLLSRQYFPEGMFFGRHYRNQVVALSYEPPSSLDAIDRLALGAVWIDAAQDCRIDLFRRDFAKPAAWADRGWRASPTAFDGDFLRAHVQVAYMTDLKPAVSALAAKASGWGVVAWNKRGALFVRGGGERVDVGRLCAQPR